jgi:hypothetical protein
MVVGMLVENRIMAASRRIERWIKSRYRTP